uniref:Protein kinase domain-containing protein n=1 Tax=Acrobeloides nanus TaxID=290746 RepID=A0A914DHR7_9BILA
MDANLGLINGIIKTAIVTASEYNVSSEQRVNGIGKALQQSSVNKAKNLYPDGLRGVENDKLAAEIHNAYAKEFEAGAHMIIICCMFLESQVPISLFSVYINQITTSLAADTPLSQYQPQIDAWRNLQEYYDPIVDRLIKLDEINKNFMEYSKNRENQICSPSTSDFINSEMKLIQEYTEILEKWINEQKAREKESLSKPNSQNRTYLEDLLVKYDHFCSLANYFSSLLKLMELIVFYHSTKEIPKETCDFIKKYLKYEVSGADGSVFKVGSLSYVGFAIKTLSKPEAISFYQDKGVKLRHDRIIRYMNLSLRPLPEMVPNVLKNLIKECLDRDPDRRPSFSEIVDTIPKIREAIIQIDEKTWHNISQRHIQIDNIDHWAATEAAYLVLRDHSK